MSTVTPSRVSGDRLTCGEIDLRSQRPLEAGWVRTCGDGYVTSVTVLCYHDLDASWDSPISIDPKAFARQIAWLASNRRIVPAGEAVQMMDRRGGLPAGIASI